MAIGWLCRGKSLALLIEHVCIQFTFCRYWKGYVAILKYIVPFKNLILHLSHFSKARFCVNNLEGCKKGEKEYGLMPYPGGISEGSEKTILHFWKSIFSVSIQNRPDKLLIIHPCTKHHWHSGPLNPYKDISSPFLASNQKSSTLNWWCGRIINPRIRRDSPHKTVPLWSRTVNNLQSSVLFLTMGETLTLLLLLVAMPLSSCKHFNCATVCIDAGRDPPGPRQPSGTTVCSEKTLLSHLL